MTLLFPLEHMLQLTATVCTVMNVTGKSHSNLDLNDGSIQRKCANVMHLHGYRLVVVLVFALATSMLQKTITYTTSFSLLEQKVFLAILLQKFEVQLADPAYEIKFDRQKNFVLTPEENFGVKLVQLQE